MALLKTPVHTFSYEELYLRLRHMEVNGFGALTALIPWHEIAALAALGHLEIGPCNNWTISTSGLDILDQMEA
jgi:hypothetical protein